MVDDVTEKIFDDWCKENGITREEFAFAEPGSISDLFKKAFGFTAEQILGVDRIEWEDVGGIITEDADLDLFGDLNL